MNRLLTPLIRFRQSVEAKALQRLGYETGQSEVTGAENLEAAMKQYCYYECFVCHVRVASCCKLAVESSTVRSNRTSGGYRPACQQGG